MELIKASLMAAAGGGKSANLQMIAINQNNSRHIAGQTPYEGIDGWNDIAVAVPEKDEISGSFSSNGTYTPPVGKVWNYIEINVDEGYETQNTYEELEEFFDDEEPKFINKNMTWQIKHYPVGESYTVTFGNGPYTPRTVTFSGGGFILFTWLDGHEYKMQDAIWPSGNSYRFEKAKDANVYINSNNQWQLDVTHVYSNSVVTHNEQVVSVTFPQDVTLEVMNDNTGYKITN